MRQSSLLRFRLAAFLFVFALFTISVTQGQGMKKLDFSKDTLKEADVIGARNTYLNNLRGNGKKATERINLPVDKLKEIIDACAANNITDISVMIITIGQANITHFKSHNPGATDDQLKGSQMLVFKVPRSAFAGALGAKINLSSNPLMLSLLGAGLVLVDPAVTGLPFGGDLYFSVGGICPPPASCD
jgi:hypothetical protein